MFQVCVETTCLNTESVEGAELYVVSPESVAQSTGVVTSSVSMAMPNLNDRRNNITASACGANKVTTTMTVDAEKIPHNGKRSREPKEQMNVRTQELPKKLVKALAEKIMKRMNQKDQETSNAKTELETAVSNLPEGEVTRVSVENIERSFSQSVGNNVLKEIGIEQNHDSILENLPVNLPVIEAEHFEASPASIASYSSSHQTPLTVNNATHSLSLIKDVKCAQTGTQTQLVNVSQTAESAIVTRHVTPPIFSKDKTYTHAPALTAKQAQYLRQNSVPATNQNGYQMNNSNNVTMSFQGSNGPPPMYYFPETNTGHFNMCPNPTRSTVTSHSDLMLERYIQQQTPYIHEHPTYRGHSKDTSNLKSPDSGFCEPCVSPRELNQVVCCCYCCCF